MCLTSWRTATRQATKSQTRLRLSQTCIKATVMLGHRSTTVSPRLRGLIQALTIPERPRVAYPRDVAVEPSMPPAAHHSGKQLLPPCISQNSALFPSEKPALRTTKACSPRIARPYRQHCAGRFFLIFEHRVQGLLGGAGDLVSRL